MNSVKAACSGVPRQLGVSPFQRALPFGGGGELFRFEECALEFFLEAIPFILLLNEQHLFSLTQHVFIFIQLIKLSCTLHVSTCKIKVK